ncbi:unnamed protein product [Bursaphelenchus okinawaensis]|uniref:Uncharacterized protein n=1 Tax=Bursaphelenchus okinawaensis TaxID=465554 RepID=A0A811L9E9_9BILA|nr:unnamed protein product [Bursaphelenchus okinawaensis]CAG9119814.1 unnamed protein product [Bursaphelenchus okinawaensis]
MKYVNECILKPFEQIFQALVRGFGMISDTNALEHLRLALQNDQPVVNDVTPKEPTLFAEPETVGIVVNEEIAIEKDRLSEELQNTKEKLTKAMNDKSEWEATVHAMEQELDVIRRLRDASNGADAGTYDRLADQSRELEKQREEIHKLKFSGSTSPISSTGETPPRENSFKRNIRRMVGK